MPEFQKGAGTMNVEYDKSDETMMDIYWPANNAKTPSSGWKAVIILHGQGGTRMMRVTGRLHHRQRLPKEKECLKGRTPVFQRSRIERVQKAPRAHAKGQCETVQKTSFVSKHDPQVLGNMNIIVTALDIKTWKR